MMVREREMESFSLTLNTEVNSFPSCFNFWGLFSFPSSSFPTHKFCWLSYIWFFWSIYSRSNIQMLFPCFSIWHIFNPYDSVIFSGNYYSTLFIGIPQNYSVHLFDLHNTQFFHMGFWGGKAYYFATLKIIQSPKIYGKPWLKKCKFSCWVYPLWYSDILYFSPYVWCTIFEIFKHIYIS